MTKNAHPNLHRLIARMRRRLWLERALALLEWGLWGAAGLLLAAAAVHVLLVVVPWGHGLGLALLPPLTALLVAALLQRPTAASAALASDRRFRGHEIFTSALEQTAVAPHARPGASDYVLEDAEARAGAVVEQAWAWQWRPSARSVLPLALAISCLFLLLSPGARPHPAPPGIAQDSPIAPVPGHSADDVVRLDLQLLREVEKFKTAVERADDKSGTSATTNRPNRSSATAAASGAGAEFEDTERSKLVPGNRPAAKDSTEQARVTTGDEEMIEARTTFTTTQGGAGGGDAAGKKVDRTSMHDETADVPQLGVHPVEIERRPAEAAGSRARSLESVELGASSPIRDERGLPSLGGSAEMSYEMWLSPGLRAYAQAYLAALGRETEP